MGGSNGNLKNHKRFHCELLLCTFFQIKEIPF